MTPDLVKFLGWSLVVFSIGSYFNIAFGIALLGIYYVVLGVVRDKNKKDG